MATGKQILDEAKTKMKKSGEALQRTLADIRAGRANASLLNSVKVDYYGAPTPLNQVASITIPEARQLLVTPFDESSLDNIEKGIYAANLGLTPQNDGSAIRIVIPQLTEDRRKELVKEVKAELEKAKVAVRNVRREAMDDLKKGNKSGDFNDDEFHNLEKKVQDETDNGIKNLEQIAAGKEKELMAN
ncbi:ribosome recycling factor [Limosilactobacillus frumenti DSM 13145]|uniref:Ribosome-recycling factor n=1 Tax=Limosilactobacillus frumenti DSM 13145 TaxID=1423746 RepID=A0A0R1P326_9LACO|nr:ribosome recycling factor [Limosilactobacillus frumenti]KRL26989.1 ribosome recycling factor [Limosilactobacillus frumenti DSM 13145]MBA2914471.1 ribosome recycling factor [Limosilactobacillus frumenti]QFG72466.1 ribosome recycling factor [Limosilactobacillus frumenti]